MALYIVYIIIGVVLVLRGADRLTEGASALARRMQVPEMIIGLTIVAAGTSAPELFVSLTSALKGSADMAVGNVIGSNILNTLRSHGITDHHLTIHRVERSPPLGCHDSTAYHSLSRQFLRNKYKG